MQNQATLQQYTDDGHSQRIAKSELKRDLEEVAEQLGYIPSISEYEEVGEFTQNPFYRAFGSWTAAIEEANLDGYEKPSGSGGGHNRLPDDQLIADLQRVVEIVGEPLARPDYEEHGDHSTTTIQSRFGSWPEALEVAGIESCYDPVWPEDIGDLVNEMCRLAEVLDRPPFTDDMDEHGEFNAHAYKQSFGSWSEALRTCGFPPRYRGGTMTPLAQTHSRYGSNWQRERQRAVERDRYRCQDCGMKQREHVDKYGKRLDVHHIIPISEFETPENANFPENLITLCRECHEKWSGLSPDIDPEEVIPE